MNKAYQRSKFYFNNKKKNTNCISVSMATVVVTVFDGMYVYFERRINLKTS